MENRAAANYKTFSNRHGRTRPILHSWARRTETAEKRGADCKVKGKHLYELYQYSRRNQRFR